MNETITDDLRLVDELAAGKSKAWRGFVEAYSPLLFAVIRRKLFAEDEDEVRTVYVDVLHDLYKGKIAEYSGRSPLSAWLVVVARGTALDYLRRRNGRDQPPAGFDKLSDLEKEILRLRHVEGLDLEAVIGVLRTRGHDIELGELVDTLHRLEREVGARYLRRLEYNLKAARAGIDSGRLLQYMVVARSRAGEGSLTPLDLLLGKEAKARTNTRVRSVLSLLPRQEREVLKLRYLRGWPANRVASILRLPDATRVYQITRRAINRVQRYISASEEG